MQRSDIDVGYIHRHLRNAILVDVPANGLGTLQGARLHDRSTVGIEKFFACNRITLSHRSAFFSHVKCNGVGSTGGGSVKVEVDCNKEVSCSYNSTTSASHLLVVRTSSKVGSFGIIVNTLGYTLVFSFSTNSKVLAFWGKGGSLVAIARYVKLVGNTLGKVARNLSTLFKCNSTYWYNRQHICSAYTWVGTVMLAHIY